jgi:peptidoglycan hydrolase CwlO-like protein
MTKVFFILLLWCFVALLLCGSVFALCDAADCTNPDDCQRKIAECDQVLSAYSPAQNKNKQDLASLEKQVVNTEKLIKSAEAQQKKLAKSIFDREVDLGYQQVVFSARVRTYYIRSQLLSPLLIFLATDNASLLTRELSYRNTMVNEDKKVILRLSADLANLQKDKDKLEQNKKLLAQMKVTLDKQANFLRTEVQKVDSYLGTISSKIASLTAKQQSLLAEKAGTFQTTVGEVPLADDPNSRPDFNPGFSPAFAAFLLARLIARG